MGPLKGIKVVELAGIGPGPMCAMLLADLGATVLRIERKAPAKLGIARPLKYNLLLRGRKQIAVDLKAKAGVDFVLSMVEEADALIEGFRPGVTERLGLGPEACLGRNGRLVYGRMTGWGQSGPLSQAAGHDLNYIALTGALAAIGRKDTPPTPPLTLAGDLGGGALYLAFGMLAAIIEARQSGKGQVVDAGISDCAAHLMTNFFGMYAAGLMSLERGTNFSDSGAPYYDSYICADGQYVSVAPIEDKFFDLLLDKLGFDKANFPAQNDRARWPEMRRLFAGRMLEKTRDEWCAILEGTDVCFAPVLTMAEAPSHPHMKAREVFLDIDGVTQPAPAPRFSRTPAGAPFAPKAAADTPLTEALEGWQIARDVQTWTTLGAIG
ncbi:crotonobetainyl-CoA:carnitine CoA-transferase CaiB-like acyl-CoA transferase [Azorhizobium sp. AG788]|uniref:CaiB/BaiF CoA transferase family protein n=1 Tax=Azorhizobium sp. AG788 TaxID=2183897 RepID=UPI00105B8ACC|nr:CaiB/BaiF CoA-transferase family protein [Azorhizobium sp. AG788]TDU00836.1 crotonobetainyl-CoA:carnitine CoA-transferase CaiB-like acyl-CoA transferase [Azorhizobium sp. AG788]